MKGEDAALLLCQQSAVESGKKGEIHLFPKIFLRHAEKPPNGQVSIPKH
jgi:hypothetical protein